MKLSRTVLLMCTLVTMAQAAAKRKGDCDKTTGDILCRYNCGPEQLQPMCVDSACYCTDVGMGSCKTGLNNEGCKDVCQSIGKFSEGCFNDECICNTSPNST